MRRGITALKQFQFDYENEDHLISNLKRIKQWCNSTITSGILFQIYTEVLSKAKIESICDTIERIIPDSLYMGASTNGNILMGDKSKNDISIVCTVYEYPSTKIKMLQYPLDQTKAKGVVQSLLDYVDKNPWVKSITTYTTMRGMSMTEYCDDLGLLPKNIVFCGGGAISEDINETEAFVFSSEGPISDHSAVFLLTGGEDYYVKTMHVTGWKPLGRYLKVSKASGPILYELDGKPAYETYYRYLNIKNDENFFSNTLEFPFLYELNGMDILRAPIASNSDGSIVMTADVAEDVQARISYGDPWTILESVYNTAVSFQDFIPQTFTVFSCAARRTFWGDEKVGNETKPFQSLAPTSGFYTSGEFLRTGKYINQHNVTLVIEAQREGDITGLPIPQIEMDTAEFTGNVSMINRLATFIQASTEELEEANRLLGKAAITDELTRLFNRGEIQRRISEVTKNGRSKGSHGRLPLGASLIMMDLDNFKKVNDTYGHKEGDIVLRKLADMLKKIVNTTCPGGYIGRWGGEEFMVLLPNANKEKASSVAEAFRVNFSSLDFPNAPSQTLSLGVTEMIAGETSDIACMRVDDALYEAKRSGKNKVIIN